MAIACKRCGRSPYDDDGKVVLLRTNPKGKVGQWICATGTGCRATIRLPLLATWPEKREGKGAWRMNRTAQTDHPLMLEWVNNARQNGGAFLQALAFAALMADHENYPFLRPVLTIMRAKYPKYEASEAVKQELAGVVAEWERQNV